MAAAASGKTQCTHTHIRRNREREAEDSSVLHIRASFFYSTYVRTYVYMFLLEFKDVKKSGTILNLTT